MKQTFPDEAIDQIKETIRLEEQRKQQLPQQEEKKEKVGEDETPPLP